MSEYDNEIESVPLVRSEVINSCYKCNTQEGFLLSGYYEGKPSLICSSCFRGQILDDSFKQFLSDSKKYATEFFNPQES